MSDVALPPHSHGAWRPSRAPACEAMRRRYCAVMHARRQTVLITGFGPFPGVPTNASAELVPALAKASVRRLAGFNVAAAILPTEWRSGASLLLDLLGDIRPVLVLHFGVSPRTEGFAVELRGRNACSPTKDALGEEPIAACIASNGPDYLSATLPVHHIVERLRRRGLPALLSRDAGGYLCNYLLYHSLAYARRQPAAMRAGFVHIPDALSMRAGTSRRVRSQPRMDMAQAVEGGLEIIAASLGRTYALARC